MGGMENDLHELDGIGPKITEILEGIGVDSIKELSRRNPASLTKMIEERHGDIIGVSEKQVTDWIGQAKALQV